MNTALWKIGIGMVILLAVGFMGVGRLRFEGETEPPAPIYTEMLRLPPSRQEMSDFSRHKQPFDRIWFARYQRNVVDDLVKFLDDPSRSLRVRAVRSLAHLEDPAAEAPLSAKLENSQAGSIVNDKDLLLPTLLKISLARIQTRNMVGRARVDVVAKSAGLSFDEVIQLFGNTDGVIRAEEASNRDQIILAEVLDLLCVMSGKGENIQALIKGLKLNGAQNAKLQSASGTRKQRIDFVIDYLCGLFSVRREDMDLADWLAESDPLVVGELAQRLKQMQQHPKDFYRMEPYPGHPGLYRKRVGYSMLFRVAAQTGEASFLPLIRQFDDVKYAPEIRYYAVQSYQQLEMKVSLSSAVPAPERGKSRAAIG